MAIRPRRNHSPAFKAKVAAKGEKTLIELAQDFDVYPNQIKQWRDQLLEGATGRYIGFYNSRRPHMTAPSQGCRGTEASSSMSQTGLVAVSRSRGPSHRAAWSQIPSLMIVRMRASCRPLAGGSILQRS